MGETFIIMGHLRSLSIVIPAYNEEQRLPATLRAIAAYLETKGLDFVEILVVDDGSTDGTAQVARAAAAEDPRIQVLHREGKGGLGTAYLAGFLYAMDRGRRGANGCSSPMPT